MSVNSGSNFPNPKSFAILPVMMFIRNVTPNRKFMLHTPICIYETPQEWINYLIKFHITKFIGQTVSILLCIGEF
jgi:hypothetical protein